MKRKIFGILFTLVLVLSLSLVMAVPVMAANVTAASGGGAISADDYATSTYTTLGTITIAEQAVGDIGTTGNLILDVPAGFLFDNAAPPSVTVQGGSELTIATVTITTTAITIPITVNGIVVMDTITIGATTQIEVIPSAGYPLASGNIYADVTSVAIAGITTGPAGTNFGTLNEVAGAANKLKITSAPLTLTAGTQGTVTVEVQDQFGNAQPTGAYTVNLASDSTGTYNFYTTGTQTVITSIAIADAVSSGTFDYYDEKAGTPTITVTDAGVALTSDNQQQTINPDVLVSFTITGTPATILAGAAFPSAITVTAYDSYVNVKTDYTGTVTWSSSSTVATLPANYTFVGGNLGVYPFPGSQFRLSTAGTQTITVTDGAVSAISGGIAVTPTLTWGGGWAPPTPTIETNLFGKVSRFRFHITTRGEIREMIKATSGDGMLTMTIPKGTIALDKNGNPLSTLTSGVDVSPPPPPSHIIGLAYNFGPDGATFDPGITLNWNYDLDALPEGVAEEDLVIACYDEEAGEWVECPSTVDLVTHTVTASVSHFTTFAIIAHAAPAAFSASNLSIQPSEVQPKEAVTITLSVANTGGTEGSYAVVLKINGVKETEKSVTVAAGASEEVTFTTAKDVAGSYSVAVNGLSGSFTVKEKPAPAPAPPPPPPPTPPPAPEAINWWLIGGIIAAVVVVGLLIFFLVVRRRA